MPAFDHPIDEEKSYRRAIFLFVSLAVAGICSIYPVMCFKNHSSKEKDKLNQEVAKVERHAREEIRAHMPRVRHHSHSPPRIAHVPSHHRRHRRRSHSRSHIRYEDDNGSETGHRHRAHAYDQDLDHDRRRRHHGHPPPRRYHHSS